VGSAPVFDATDTPLWVFVVADLRALTAKYGQRGYRFAYLQAGHAAQNVLLVAEAMGFRARLIGGFYDDALAVFLGVDGITQIPLYMIPVAIGGPQ
jgi:SagB-type dehydrogenase family enzyme